jgi:hypothetical protein
METLNNTQITNAADSDAYLLQKISVFMEGYIIPAIMILGVFGNILSLVVFIRTRRRADAPVQYLGLLAVSDSGVILTLGLAHWLYYGLSYVTGGVTSFNIMTVSSFTCGFGGFAIHASECTSAWVITAFSIERAYVVWYPLKRASITSRKRTILIVILCFLVYVFSVHRLWLWKPHKIGAIDACFYTVNIFWLFQYDTFIHNYLPCLAILLANTLILIGVRRAQSAVNTQTVASKKTTQDRRILVSLMTVSTFYIFFMLPASTSFAYFNYIVEWKNYSASFVTFMNDLVTFFDQFSMLNFCFNFVIYGCTLPFYREEVRKMFRVCCISH